MLICGAYFDMSSVNLVVFISNGYSRGISLPNSSWWMRRRTEISDRGSMFSVMNTFASSKSREMDSIDLRSAFQRSLVLGSCVSRVLRPGRWLSSSPSSLKPSLQTVTHFGQVKQPWQYRIAWNRQLCKWWACCYMKIKKTLDTIVTLWTSYCWVKSKEYCVLLPSMWFQLSGF